MEVHFVDVGLGTCQIIHLGNNEAIVIDCGLKSDAIAANSLRRLGINRIVRLITSHSDGDHVGGAPTVLTDYQGCIDQILAVQDHKWLDSIYWKRIADFIDRGLIAPSNVLRLELVQDNPRLVWENDQGSRLRLVSPTFIRNLTAQQKRSSNGTSAVFILDHCGKRVVFAGDSVISQWKEIHQQRQLAGLGRLDCDILAVPHHGGRLGGNDDDVDWLYGEVVRSDFAVLSVGTSSKHPRHPRPEIIARLLNSGSRILCTELTRLCHERPLSMWPAVLQPQTQFGRGYIAARRKKANCVACMGTVVATLTKDKCDVRRFDDHQLAVRKMANQAGGNPMCLAGGSLG